MNNKHKSGDRPLAFDALDYRVYMREIMQYLRKSGDFSLREFARKAGIKSPGFLKMVIDGKRKVTQKTAQGFCRAFGITGKERKYFLLLVEHAQENDPDKKKSIYDALLAGRPRSSDFLREKKQSRYFSRPYYVCVREMVALPDFREDPKWIARRCFPKIKPSEAEEAIATLLDLGLLKRDASGRLVQSEEFVQTQDNIKSGIETYHYHEAMLKKARYALGSLAQDERNYYALTLPLSKSVYDEFVQEYYALRDRMVKKIEERAASCSKAGANQVEEVYQINFQIFPLTRRREDEN